MICYSRILMQKTKVCLVYPDSIKLPSYFKRATNISTDIKETLPPLGMLYIIGNSKYQIDFIDDRIEKYSFEELIHILMKYDIIGFGGTIFEIKEARRASQYLMKLGKITIYGGPNATVNWNLYLGQFGVIFRGEAELTFDQIIEHLNSLEKIGFSKISGTYINKQPFRIMDLNKLKYPDRTKINLNRYRREEQIYMEGVYPVDTIVSSRGCPFNCYFCSSKLIWDQKYTYRRVDDIIEEIKYMIKKYGSKGIYFREDNFTTNRKRLVEFCNKIKKYKIDWMCESRVDALDKETIKLMSESGCKGIWFGIESTDNVVLKKIRKNITFERSKLTISLCNKYGIVTGGGFMIGFPFDTKESIIRNYKKSKKLGLKDRFYNRVWAIPRSEMYDEIVNEGLDYYSHENIILPSTRFLSADELNELYYQLILKKKFLIKKIISVIGRQNIILLKRKYPKPLKSLKKITRKLI